jgi:hypothetical protein
MTKLIDASTNRLYGIELMAGLINSGISTLDKQEYAATKILSSIDSIADIECYRFHSPFLFAQKALCHKITGNILIECKKDPFMAIEHFNKSKDLIMRTLRNPAHRADIDRSTYRSSRNNVTRC